jgi:hypothetical protein
MTPLDTGAAPRPVVSIQVHIHRGETLPQFIARLKSERLWQHGDTVVFLSQQGRYDTVRIIHPTY